VLLADDFRLNAAAKNILPFRCIFTASFRTVLPAILRFYRKQLSVYQIKSVPLQKFSKARLYDITET
jgi:hypothetical protein